MYIYMCVLLKLRTKLLPICMSEKYQWYNGTKTFIAARIDINAMLHHCTLLKKPILESYGFLNRSDTLKIARDMYLGRIITIGHI